MRYFATPLSDIQQQYKLHSALVIFLQMLTNVPANLVNMEALALTIWIGTLALALTATRALLVKLVSRS